MIFLIYIIDYHPAYNYGNRSESKPCGSKPREASPVKMKSRHRLSYAKPPVDRIEMYSSANSSNEHEE